MTKDNLKIENFVKDFLENKKKEVFVPGKTLIPPSGKLIGSEEITNMVEPSLDAWLTTGRFNDDFQNKLADFLKVKHLITVNSGSSANLVAFSIELITPSAFSGSACPRTAGLVKSI